MIATAFKGDKVVGAILFERTMDGDVRGVPTPTYLWKERGVVPKMPELQVMSHSVAMGKSFTIVRRLRSSNHANTLRNRMQLPRNARCHLPRARRAEGGRSFNDYAQDLRRGKSACRSVCGCSPPPVTVPLVSTERK
jgi:hypothetical protein